MVLRTRELAQGVFSLTTAEGTLQVHPLKALLTILFRPTLVSHSIHAGHGPYIIDSP